MKRCRYGLLAIAAAALSWLTPALIAQEDAPAIVGRDNEARATWAAQWLRSDNPLEIAWGAWLARVGRCTTAVPLLLNQLSAYSASEGRPAQSSSSDRRDAMLQVLDALIELRAPVPVEDARKLFPEFAAQSLILLIRSPDDEQAALLEILDRARANWNWLAAGNGLLKTRSSRFTANLVAKFTEHLEVSVWDPGFGGGKGGISTECGFSLRAPKRGWPPVGLYQLTQFPDRIPWLSATFLVGGETPVYYWRAEPGNYDNPTDGRGACDDGNRDEYRAQYITKLISASFPRITLNAYPRTILEWHDDARFQRDISPTVEKQMAELREAFASLQRLGALAPMPVNAPVPRLEIVIVDERREKSVPLPPVKIDGKVEIRATFSSPSP